MKKILTFKLFENVQLADKILKSKNIPKDEFILKLENELKKNGLSAYEGYIIKYVLKSRRNFKSEEVFTDMEIEKYINLFKTIKTEKIDIDELGDIKNIYDLFDKVKMCQEDRIITKFINTYAPASLRNNVKKMLTGFGNIFSNKDIIKLKNLSHTDIELLKKGSRYKSPYDWVNYVIEIFKGDEYSLDELKNSNIKIFYEDEDLLIYKPLDHKSYLIVNFPHWCTIYEYQFNIYKDFDMNICLNKKDIKKSYIGYRRFDEWEDIFKINIHNYKDRRLEKDEYNPDILKFIKYGYGETI